MFPVQELTSEVAAGDWWYVSDSHTSRVDGITEVRRAQAYLALYERI